MLIHNRMEVSRVNGPGARAVIWVQGCLLACKNCWNPGTHSFVDGLEMTVDNLVGWILDLNGIEGVTFSGGEPMHQVVELFWLMVRVKRVRPSLSFGMFTGYTEAELEAGRYKYVYASGGPGGMPGGTWSHKDLASLDSYWHYIKERRLLDFVVAGRFVEAMTTTALPMVSSANQKLLLLTDRYRESDFKQQGVEIKIAPGGKRATITGFPVGVNL